MLNSYKIILLALVESLMDSQWCPMHRFFYFIVPVFNIKESKLFSAKKLVFLLQLFLVGYPSQYLHGCLENLDGVSSIKEI